MSFLAGAAAARASRGLAGVDEDMLAVWKFDQRRQRLSDVVEVDREGLSFTASRRRERKR